MIRKSYSIFLCFLISSTLVHELRAKSIVPVNNVEPLSNMDYEGSEVLDRSKRATSGAFLRLNLQVVGSIVIITNSTAAAIAIDIEAGAFILLNGTTGSGVYINPTNGTGSYIPGGLWNGTDESIADFIASLEGDIEALLTLEAAVLFVLSEVTEVILAEVTYMVTYLVAFIDVELEANLTLALNLVITFVVGLLSLLDGILEGLFELVGDEIIELYVDICGLLNLLEGLAYIIKLVAGTLAACIKNDVEFKLALILGAVNGLVCFINIILQLGSKFSLVALAEILGSVELLFLLIAKLGGNVIAGITGVFRIGGELVALIKNNTNLAAFIGCLVHYVVYSSIMIKEDLNAELNATLSTLLDALDQVNATATLSGLVDIVEDLIAGTLVVAGCNLSLIISKLLAGIVGIGTALLVLIVEILILIDGVIKVALSLPYLLLVLICKLNSPCGIYQLLILGIEIKLAVVGFLMGLLKFTLLSVINLVNILFGNLYEVLRTLPVIGCIVKLLEAAIKKASGGTLSLKTLFNASALVQGLIKALFRLVTGFVGIVVSGSLLARIKIILRTCTSVSVLVSVDIIAYFGFSV